MYFGIDTSCYTTSLAVIDAQGRLLSEQRQLLAVAPGERGLRQSDGLFQHLHNLPVLAEKLTRDVGALTIRAVAASTRPRPVDGSYMPVFTAGASFGRSMAALWGVPFFELSHQEGHLLAGMWSVGVAWDDFYTLHVSGGTTELLSVQMKGKPLIQELGGSQDLHAGQFIDRVGVALGLTFPAGPKLEALAMESGGEQAQVPVSVQGSILSFSGPESHVQRLIAGEQATPEVIARGVEHCVAESLHRILKFTIKKNGFKPALFVGGVMANQYIRSYLKDRYDGGCAFAEPRFAGDNAVGAALFAQNFTC